MPDKRIALVTGANQGVGLQVAKELVGNGVTVLVGSRNFERGETAAREIGAGAIALQLDVTDRVSIADAAERIRKEFGRLDLLVQNAATHGDNIASRLKGKSRYRSVHVAGESGMRLAVESRRNAPDEKAVCGSAGEDRAA